MITYQSCPCNLLYVQTLFHFLDLTEVTVTLCAMFLKDATLQMPGHWGFFSAIFPWFDTDTVLSPDTCKYLHMETWNSIYLFLTILCSSLALYKLPFTYCPLCVFQVSFLSVLLPNKCSACCLLWQPNSNSFLSNCL